jgi:hypothetical protein
LSNGMKYPHLPHPIEAGVYDISLLLDGSLEPKRLALQRTLWLAQRRLRDFALQHGWGIHVQEPFAVQAQIFSAKQSFDRALLELCNMDINIELPATYCAALEKNILLCVSPELYQQVYPEGVEEDSFEKLLAHEMAHRLHIRVLGGDEEAMGPVWFYEGFALYAANQFERSLLYLSSDDIWNIVGVKERGNYQQYATVFRYFLSKVSLQQLVEMAGQQDFIDRLRCP